MGASMNRLENWPERLAEFICRTPHDFDWSTCNCALFAADGVKSQTGVDFAAPYRGPKTKRGMISRLRKVCGGGVEEAATRELGEPLDNPKLAKRGDVVSALVSDDDYPALGICIGAKAVFVSEDDGLIYVPCELWRKAWSV